MEENLFKRYSHLKLIAPLVSYLTPWWKFDYASCNSLAHPVFYIFYFWKKKRNFFSFSPFFFFHPFIICLFSLFMYMVKLLWMHYTYLWLKLNRQPFIKFILSILNDLDSWIVMTVSRYFEITSISLSRLWSNSRNLEDLSEFITRQITHQFKNR